MNSTVVPPDPRLPKLLIPMIRRTFPELITSEIVGVQLMSGPVGLAFALRYSYCTYGQLIKPDQLAYSVLLNNLQIHKKLLSHPWAMGFIIVTDNKELEKIFPKDVFAFKQCVMLFNCKVTPHILKYAKMSPHFVAHNTSSFLAYKERPYEGFLLFKVPF